MSEERLSAREIERANNQRFDQKDSPEVEAQKQNRVRSVIEDWNRNIKSKAEGGN